MHASTIAFIMAAASGAMAAPAYTSISGIPGGCNPAHPGGCPSSYFETSVAPAATSISGIPGGCNPAHLGSCPSSYFETSVVPSATSIPGGCNPAHPGSCPSSYFSTSVVPSPTSIPGGCNPAHPGSCPSSTAAAPAAASTATANTWTVKNLSRYCSDDSKGCDYNFKLEADGAETNCTVIQLDVGPTGNWGGQKCTDGSDYSVYWGYSADASPPFAVMTINNDKQKTRAFFGVPDVNGQEGSTYGSGSWAELGPEPVLANK